MAVFYTLVFPWVGSLVFGFCCSALVNISLHFCVMSVMIEITFCHTLFSFLVIQDVSFSRYWGDAKSWRILFFWHLIVSKFPYDFLKPS